MGKDSLIFKHPDGAFLWEQIASVEIIPTLASENNAYTVTLKTGQKYEILKHSSSFTMETFIDKWESELMREKDEV